MPKSKAEESYYPECVLQEILRKILQLTDRSVKDLEYYIPENYRAHILFIFT